GPTPRGVPPFPPDDAGRAGDLGVDGRFRRVTRSRLLPCRLPSARRSSAKVPSGDRAIPRGARVACYRNPNVRGDAPVRPAADRLPHYSIGTLPPHLTLGAGAAVCGSRTAAAGQLGRRGA